MRSHRACAAALLEGNQEGAVFVDRRDDPATALVCPGAGFYFALGSVDPARLRAFMPELRAWHLVPKCLLFATSAEWRRALDSLLPERIIRTGFHYCPPDEAGRGGAALPPGFALERMDARVDERWGPGLDPWILEIYGGAERFASRSFGWAVRHAGRIVSFTAACAVGGGEAEAEVGTAPELRGRGLATAAARAWLDECSARGLVPAWSCSAGNTPSEALARRLGFLPTETVYGYPLDAGPESPAARPCGAQDG